MSIITWNDTTKTWAWFGFSTQTDNSHDEEGSWYADRWTYGVKKRLIGDTTWTNFIYELPHVSSGTYSYSIPGGPQFYAQAGYEYQGYRVNVLGYDGSQDFIYSEPSDIIAPLGGGYTGLTISINPVDGISQTTVLATIVGGVTIHAISGKADVIGETTVLATVIGGTPSSYALTGTVRVGGAITPNIRVIAVKTDGSKVFTAISNTDGTFSVSVEVGTYLVLGVYNDGSGNKYSSLITPYVEVA